MKKKKSSFFDMQFITSSISTMLVLLLLGIIVFFVMTARTLSSYVRENISFTVVLDGDMKRQSIVEMQKQLTKEDFVKEIQYISKEQALKEQSQALGTDPGEFLGYNPFTSSFEIKLKADYANADSLKWIEDKIKDNKSVLEIDYPEDLLNTINQNIKKISFTLFILAALLALISFALINNTIKLTIYSKRFLINTMKLVGAKWSFIRKPFLRKNIWIGILAAIMADIVLVGMAFALLNYEPDLITIITPFNMLIVMGAVFVFGVVITILCAFISLNKYLRMTANELYYI